MASKRTSVAFDDFSATYCRGKSITWFIMIAIWIIYLNQTDAVM